MKKLYITTAIDYVNGDPHLGHAYEKVLADVIARYYRAKLGPEQVRFQGGTDEHGSKNYRAAREAGQDPAPFTARQSQKFYALREKLGVSWDDFIQTSDQERHWPAAQEMWRRLEASGDIYKQGYKGLYCEGCEAFKMEREIVGGRCVLHPSRELERVEEENWFFRLSKYQKPLLEHYRKHPEFVWPDYRRTEILNLIESGLEDVSFSRPKSNLPWGVPVPSDDSQVMYVWCDALTNYISALGFPDETKLEEWWGEGTEVIHVIGKDILRFHAALWPAMLLSAGLPLPNTIFVHGFIHTSAGKLSKSEGNLLDPFELARRYGPEAVRYFLLSQIPVGQDGEFELDRFEEVYNAALANNLGNLVTRVYSMIDRYLDGQAPSGKVALTQRGPSPDELMASFKLDDFCRAILELSDGVNKALERSEPWKQTSGAEAQRQSLGSAHLAVQEIGRLLGPFLPETSERIKSFVKDGRVELQPPLFPRLER